MARQRNRGQAQEHSGSHLDQTLLLKIFKDQGKPLSIKEILDKLKGGKISKSRLIPLLDMLVDSGRLIRIQGAFGLAESMSLLTGQLEMQRSGVGFVLCEDKRRRDVFINPRDLGEAWHGDKVVVALIPKRGERRPEGRIVRILERASSVFTSRVERNIRQDLYLCRPTDPRQRHLLLLETAPDVPKPQIGDVLSLLAKEKIDHQLYAADLLQTLGAENDVSVQEQLVKINHKIPTTFPTAALREAETLPGEPAPEDISDRRDLRGLSFVTIDGDKARDFDDAVYVEKNSQGFRLWVAIADVAHYVSEGSALDQEAVERGNSYYFPQSVEPMFPEALSNGLCSLKPQVPRLAMVVETDFSAKGLPQASRLYPAVIKSQARLTYDQVNRGLLLGEKPDVEALAPVLPMLQEAEKLARLLKSLRKARGSLDFDLPEPEILFNLSGETVDIRPRVRHFGHQIIEEFMIAANEAVARFLTEHEAHFPYRVHPEPNPDKLEALFGLLRNTELAQSLPEEATPKGLQHLLAQAGQTDLEFLVNRLALRSMMQAKYNGTNMGHYGLASECYCHFTSPIRRYADLMVHRALKAVLTGKRPSGSPKRLQAIYDEISQRERVAMEAEREILKRLTVIFLTDKVGQDFTGVINSLADFGFWVELSEVMAEGMVRLSTLTDDYYTLFPERQELLGRNTGKRFGLGTKVQVTLTDVNLGRLEVNLRITDAPQAAEKQKRKTRGSAPRPRRGA